MPVWRNPEFSSTHTPTMNRNWQYYFLKLAVSALLIGFITWNFDVGNSAVRLTELRPGFVILAIVVFGVLLFNNTVRWRFVMLAIETGLSFRKCFRLLYIGIFFNQTLPSSVGGDAVRMYLARKHGLSLSGAINGVILERIAAVSGLILLVVVTQPLVLARIGDNPVKLIFPTLAVLAAIGIIILMLLDRFPDRYQRLKIVRGFTNLATDTKLLFLSPRWAILAVGLGVTGNILIAFATFLLAKSLNVDVTILDCLGLVPPVILITTIPISIAGWGLREGAMVMAFAFVGIPEGDAFVVSVLFGLINILVSLPGGVLWITSGYKRDDVVKEISAEREN